MRIFWTLLLSFFCGSVFGQVRDRHIADMVKDAFLAKYNSNDLKGVYQLTDTTFSKHITESQLIGFLRGNRNSGNILKDSLLGEINGKFTYLLMAESRDMRLNLEVTAAKKITGFGLSNAPLVLTVQPKAVKSSNAMQTPLDRLVDSAAREYFRNPHAQAVAIGFIKKGKRYTYYYGDITTASLFEIGSITKTFTGTLLAQAVIDGKVALSDDIRRYLTGDYPNLVYNGRPVTLQDLANHTSRLPELPNDIGTQPNFNPLKPEKGYTIQMFYAALHRVKLDTLPGYKYNYSNFGISVLGHILEHVYGESYADLLNKYITRPFGMKSSYYELDAKQQAMMTIPHGENGRPVPFQEEGMFGPAGELHATLNDMLFYLAQQIKETEPAVKLSHQPTLGNVGLAWGVRNTGPYRDIQHNGSTIGSTSHLSAFPELNSGCVLLTNSKANLGKLIGAIQLLARSK